MKEIQQNDISRIAIGKINENFDELEKKCDGESDVAVYQSDKKTLFIGSLQNAIPTNSSTVFQTPVLSNACMKSVVNFPKLDTTYYFKLPKNIGCKVYSAVTVCYTNESVGLQASDKLILDVTNKESGVRIDGESYTPLSNKRFYCLAFIYISEETGLPTDASIEPEVIENLIKGGNIEITYDDNSPNVIERNVSCERYLMAMRRENKSAGYMDYYPCIGHISDLHGDAQRLENFLTYCDYIGVDSALITGDSVACYTGNGSYFVSDIAKKHTSTIAYILGNHEVQAGGIALDDSVLMNRFVNPYIDDNNYRENKTTAANHLYWYQDIKKDDNRPKRNLRIIHVCIYMDGTYIGSGNGGKYTQAQMQWFVDTLANTPAGWGIVVIMHVAETSLTEVNGYGKFNHIPPTTGAYVSAARPIRTIIDKFITGTNGEETLTIGEKNVSSYTINLDFSFSDLEEGEERPEFICYCCGHTHKDYIGTVQGAINKQLVLTVVSGDAIFNLLYLSGANESDLPRGTTGVVQDAFNIYIIDRDNGNIKIARIGSNLTKNMSLRDWMIIPYKD